MKNSLLVFGTSNFNNSLNEIKEYLEFSLLFYKKGSFHESSTYSFKSLLVDGDITNDSEFLSVINKLKKIPILLLQKKDVLNVKNLTFTEKLVLPLSLLEINCKVTNLIMSSKFNKNSSVQIKDYIIDKNEKILKKGRLSIAITEKEIQLIELLLNEKKPVSKNIILKKVWKYSENVDTHTVETHVYRLKKKIFDRFKEDNFIIHLKSGYSI